MKTVKDKALTALVRSMKASLAKSHGITVPSSALRASYLLALGENPHAFSGRQVAPAAPAALRISDNNVTRTLYLAYDDCGCLTKLALDAEGRHPLPQAWQAQAVTVLSVYAELPDINKYGLPDYVAGARSFFSDEFGFDVSRQASMNVKDLGDDSGDTCHVDVSIPLKEWQVLVQLALSDDPGTQYQVAEFVRKVYSEELEHATPEKQVAWVERYLAAMQAEHAKTEADVTFEWVYPDEDRDSCRAVVDLKTGALTLKGGVPNDIEDCSVRTRIVDDTWSDPIEVKLQIKEGVSSWKLPKKGLKELKKLLS